MDFRNWQLHGDFWWDFTQKSWGNPDILWKSPWKSQAVQEVIDLEDFDAWEAVLTNFGAFHGGTPLDGWFQGKSIYKWWFIVDLPSYKMVDLSS
jgi:nicotinamidase-related amidase